MAHPIKILNKEAYQKLIDGLLETKRVYGPVRDGKRVAYRRIGSFNDLVTDVIIPDMSAKSQVFPQVEKLFSYIKNKDDITIQDIDLNAIPEKILVGVRPCDAAAMESLKAIFGWDPADPIFEARMERTTLISIACNRSDSYCFCTSVGGGPGNTTGSDILLTQTDSGDFLAEILSPKGEALVANANGLFTDGESACEKEKYLARIPRVFDDSHLEEKVQAAFDTDIFNTYSLPCLGCAACAYVCPTCACFDIQDEKKGSQGQRIRSWDSCGSKLFTLHTSGHNPRETQGARWRQRLMHKFSYMPDRLNIRGCVGCGRCSRSCPADLNIADCLNIIAGKSATEE